MMTLMRSMAGAGAILLVASFAAAQTPAPAPLRVRGTIESVDGQTLNVKTRDGATLKVKLADKAPVRTVVRQTIDDVKKGSFIGVTAMPQPDGTQKAVEIHIFPESMRGTGEGYGPWDLMPGSTMTNAAVDSEVESSEGKALVLKYNGGEKKFIVPGNVVVVAFAPGSAADLKPGAKVFVARASKEPDGTLLAPNVTVGRDGVDPPM